MAADVASMVNDTPQARELMRYLVSADAQTTWVRGGVLSSNMRVHDYPDPISARAADLLAAAQRIRFDASDAMPDEMSATFREGVLAFSRDQSRLSEVLARLDSVRSTAYGE